MQAVTHADEGDSVFSMFETCSRLATARALELAVVELMSSLEASIMPFFGCPRSCSAMRQAVEKVRAIELLTLQKWMVGDDAFR